MSAFQRSLVRSIHVYINIIDYRGSILANLNNTMGTKQHATKKNHSYKKNKQDLQGTIFCGGGISSRKYTMYLSF